jgi:hypothetical protein
MLRTRQGLQPYTCPSSCPDSAAALCPVVRHANAVASADAGMSAWGGVWVDKTLSSRKKAPVSHVSHSWPFCASTTRILPQYRRFRLLPLRVFFAALHWLSTGTTTVRTCSRQWRLFLQDSRPEVSLISLSPTPQQGYSILALKLGAQHPLVRFSELYVIMCRLHLTS